MNGLYKLTVLLLLTGLLALLSGPGPTRGQGRNPKEAAKQPAKTTPAETSNAPTKSSSPPRRTNTRPTRQPSCIAQSQGQRTQQALGRLISVYTGTQGTHRVELGDGDPQGVGDVVCHRSTK